MRPLARLVSLPALLAALVGAPLLAQPAEPAAAARRELSGIPALNFDADEGVGYGAIAQLVAYGADSARAYRWMLQPTLFRTTRGRSDVTVFLDGPQLVGGGWRLTAFAGREHHRATSWYGVGNATARDTAREDGADAYYHRFGRRQLRATADFQHGLGTLPIRVLVGGGASRAAVDLSPYDEGTTLLAEELAGVTPPPVRTTWARAGLVLDTRDREVGPTRGRWAELLVQRADDALGGDRDFTRASVAWREYHSLSPRLVLAGRAVLQQVAGDVPFHELSTIQGSFKPTEGVGGAGSVRGLPKNRYAGEGIALYGAELRWRARDLRLRDREGALVLSAFADAGRVWEERIRASELASDLHAGAGVGARLALGRTFVVALDVAHSAQATAPLYLGLGYAY